MNFREDPEQNFRELLTLRGAQYKRLVTALLSKVRHDLKLVVALQCHFKAPRRSGLFCIAQVIVQLGKNMVVSHFDPLESVDLTFR